MDKKQSAFTRRLAESSDNTTQITTINNRLDSIDENTSNKIVQTQAQLQSTNSQLSNTTNTLQFHLALDDPNSLNYRLTNLENAPPSGGGGGIDPTDPDQPILLWDNFINQSNGDESGTVTPYPYGGSPRPTSSQLLTPSSVQVYEAASETDHIGIVQVLLPQFNGSGVLSLVNTPGTDSFTFSDFNVLYFIIKTENPADNYNIKLGLFDDVNTPSQGIFFNGTKGGNWIPTVNDGTTVTGTTTTLANNTWYILKIQKKTATSVGFTINGGTEVVISTNVPTGYLTCGIRIENLIVSPTDDVTFLLDFFSLKLKDTGALTPGTTVIGTADEVSVNLVGTEYQVGLVDNIIVNSAHVDTLKFDTAITAPSLTPGQLSWDTDFDGLTMQVATNINTPVNHATYQRVHNTSGVTINKGDIVYVSGATGIDRVAISKAMADTEATSSTTIGLAAEDIIHGADGRVITHGLLRGVTTIGYTLGDLIFLSESTPGGWRVNHPDAPNHGTFVGWIVKVAGGGAGSIFVKIHNYNEITELSDVYIPTTPADNDLLQWDLTDGRWENRSLASAGVASTSHSHTLDGLSNVTVPSPASKDSICWDSGTSTWVNSPVWLDPTNPSSPVIFVDDFLNQNNETGEVGNNAWTFTNLTIPQWAGELNHPGIIRLRCSGTANILGHMSTSLTNAGSTNQFNIDNLQEFTIVFREVQTDLDTYRVYGICGTVTSTTSLFPGVYIRKGIVGGAAGSWYFVTRNGGGSETFTLFQTSDTNWHKMKVTYSAGSVSFYMDGATSPTATHTTNIPTNLIVSPYIVLIPTGTSLVRQTDIDFVSYKLNPTR